MTLFRSGPFVNTRRVILTMLISAFACAASAADAVKVRFSWKLKGEYAHMYLAEERGLYAAQGLQVRMGEGAGSQAALGALLQGQEDVVILPGIFAISAIQKGMPVKIIALYHPKAPIALISQPDQPLKKPKDLEGRSIAHAVGETGTTYLAAFCAANQVDCTKLRKVQMDAQARVPQFLQKQVDLVSVYTNNDLPMIQARTGTRYPTLMLAAHGLAIPGLAAVASNATIAKQPDVLKRYLAAVNLGIEATRKDPKAAASALAQAWQGGPPLDVIELQVRATMDAIPNVPGRPTGWIESADIGHALELLQTEEQIGAPKPLETFFTNELLSK